MIFLFRFYIYRTGTRKWQIFMKFYKFLENRVIGVKKLWWHGVERIARHHDDKLLVDRASVECHDCHKIFCHMIKKKLWHQKYDGGFGWDFFWQGHNIFDTLMSWQIFRTAKKFGWMQNFVWPRDNFMLSMTTYVVTSGHQLFVATRQHVNFSVHDVVNPRADRKSGARKIPSGWQKKCQSGDQKNEVRMVKKMESENAIRGRGGDQKTQKNG